MKQCPYCRRQVPDDAGRCPHEDCGRAFSAAPSPLAPGGARRPAAPPARITVPSGSDAPAPAGAASTKPTSPKRPPPPPSKVSTAADSEQRKYLRSLQRRVEVGRKRSLWLAVAAAAAVFVCVGCWIGHRLSVVSGYARLAEQMRLERSGADPDRVILWYSPQSGGTVGFRRAEAGRETELLDELPAEAASSEQKFEWRWRGLRTGDVLKVTSRSGWSLVTRELAVPEPSPAPPLGDAILIGEVVSAIDNKPVSGATVRIVGTRLSAVTGADGRCRIADAPEGPVGIEVSKPGYIPEQLEQVLASGRPTDLRVVVSPGTDKIRVVLTWGNEPRDLDAHLEGPLPEGKRFHVCFRQPGDLKSREYVNLDVDAQNGQGPETITVLGVLPGKYHYWVHDYTHRNDLSSAALTQSGAQVRVYQGGQTRSFRVNGRSQGNIWRVCDIEVTDAGAAVAKIDRYESKLHEQAADVRLVAGGNSAIAPKEPEQIAQPIGAEPAISPTPGEPRPLRLAVTRERFDDMGKLLRSLGEGYRYDELADDEVNDAGKIHKYDVLFLNCWVPDVHRETLRRYVAAGGTLYTGCYQYPDVARAFPESTQGAQPYQGSPMNLNAEILDGGLRDLFGGQLPLRFDTAWKAACFQGKSVTVYLRGAVPDRPNRNTSTRVVPLLVKFPCEKGTVIFTAFHNEKQNTEMELKLLRYIVFSAVTARVDAEVAKGLADRGFSPERDTVGSASQGEDLGPFTYTCEKRGPLQFILVFEGRGARLRLKVTGPNGEKHEQEGTKTFAIDVPDPALGPWKYSVTVLHVPYGNFPMRVKVAQK